MLKRLFAVLALLLLVLVAGASVANAEGKEWDHRDRNYSCEDLKSYAAKAQVAVDNQTTVVAGLQISGPAEDLAEALIKLSELKTKLAIVLGKIEARCPRPTTVTATVTAPTVVVPIVERYPVGAVDTGGGSS